jgi:mycothiol synthase
MMERRQERGSFTVRPMTLDDADRVIDLINTAALADTGMVGTNRSEQLNEWGLPQFNMETDTRLVFEPGGRLAGFAELWDTRPHVRHYVAGHVHPDYRGLGIGGELIAWAEDRARRSLDKAPQDASVVLASIWPHENAMARDLYQAHGFVLSRRFFRMRIEMQAGEGPPAPAWPEGMRVRPYLFGQDDRAVYQLMDQAFQDHWGYVEGESFEEWLHWLEHDPTFDPSLCFLALASGEQLVGALMARPQWEVDPSMAWIDEIGVLRPWRRRGIGLALLRQSLGAFHRRGIYKVGLGVDGESLTGATRLYERAGMHVFQQRDAYEKVLRPGKDLTTRDLEEDRS